MLDNNPKVKIHEAPDERYVENSSLQSKPVNSTRIAETGMAKVMQQGFFLHMDD